MSSRVYLIVAFVSLAGYLFGADTGSIGSITTMPQFKDAFGDLSPIVQGLVVSSILLPSAFSGLAAGPMSDRISRKYTIMTGALIFAAGSALSAGSPNLSTLFVGRCVAGVGEGFFLASMGVYVTEISPKRLRGRLMAIPSLLIATGIAAGFFICYGSVKTSSSLSWRLPFALQTLFSLILAIGCIFIIPFSPRWLMHKGRNEEAGKVLEYIDKSTAEEEKEELAVSQAESTTRGFKVQELWEKKVRMRTFLTVFMQAEQQLSGIDAVLYYAPLLFTQAGLSASSAALVASGVSGILLVISTLITSPFADRIPRRTMFLGGGIANGTIMLLLGLLYASGASGRPAGRWAIIIFIELFVVAFSASWAIVVRTYTSEIHPIRTRSAASCLGISVNQTVNFLIAMTTPLFLSKSTSGPYFMFSGCLFAAVLVCWFLMLETLGESLESINKSFEQSKNPLRWTPFSKKMQVFGSVANNLPIPPPRSETASIHKDEEIEMEADIGHLVSAGGASSRVPPPGA